MLFNYLFLFLLLSSSVAFAMDTAQEPTQQDSGRTTMSAEDGENLIMKTVASEGMPKSEAWFILAQSRIDSNLVDWKTEFYLRRAMLAGHFEALSTYLGFVILDDPHFQYHYLLEAKKSYDSVSDSIIREHHLFIDENLSPIDTASRLKSTMSVVKNYRTIKSLDEQIQSERLAPKSLATYRDLIVKLAREINAPAEHVRRESLLKRSEIEKNALKKAAWLVEMMLNEVRPIQKEALQAIVALHAQEKTKSSPPTSASLPVKSIRLTAPTPLESNPLIAPLVSELPPIEREEPLQFNWSNLKAAISATPHFVVGTEPITDFLPNFDKGTSGVLVEALNRLPLEAESLDTFEPEELAATLELCEKYSAKGVAQYLWALHQISTKSKIRDASLMEGLPGKLHSYLLQSLEDAKSLQVHLAPSAPAHDSRAPSNDLKKPMVQMVASALKKWEENPLTSKQKRQLTKTVHQILENPTHNSLDTKKIEKNSVSFFQSRISDKMRIYWYFHHGAVVIIEYTAEHPDERDLESIADKARSFRTAVHLES